MQTIKRPPYCIYLPFSFSGKEVQFCWTSCQYTHAHVSPYTQSLMIVTSVSVFLLQANRIQVFIWPVPLLYFQTPGNEHVVLWDTITTENFFILNNICLFYFQNLPLPVSRMYYFSLSAKQYIEENIFFAIETCISGHTNNTEWIRNASGISFYNLLMSKVILLWPLHNFWMIKKLVFKRWYKPTTLSVWQDHEGGMLHTRIAMKKGEVTQYNKGRQFLSKSKSFVREDTKQTKPPQIIQEKKTSG